MKKTTISIIIGAMFVIAPLTANADTMNDLRAQVASLLQMVTQLQQQLTQAESTTSAVTPIVKNVGTQTTGAADNSLACLTLNRNLWQGIRGADVSQLQILLQKTGDYTYHSVTGYYGPATEQAVQRYQQRKGIISYGTPNTTGYGVVGPKTREYMQVCGVAGFGRGPSRETTEMNESQKSESPIISNLTPDQLQIISPASNTTINIGDKITIRYIVGSGIVSGDPAIIDRSIVKANTNTKTSGYVSVSNSFGSYSFDWLPNESGTYQALLSINHNNRTYQVRSGIITVVDPNSTTPPIYTPSITFSHISSGNVIGSFMNLPPNSQIRFVNSATTNQYDAQSTMVLGGGSGPLSIPIPNDLPNGTYYLRVTSYYSPSTTIVQSNTFRVGNDIQTKNVVINSFTASPATVKSGQAVLLRWTSNLTHADKSYYGGGCNIEALAGNRAVHVTSTHADASGSVTHTPTETTTYTLRCHSGGKDGSPNSSRQIVVQVIPDQTDPVVINYFTASKKSLASGESVTFSWNSNLTNDDITVQGGGCHISAITSYNQQIHITPVRDVASGSKEYTPALTATYTLRCQSGGKDGSPMDAKQVTVSVN
jgi:peptidoglycan hydrolase-like protein with peptidoglycan-binding domain